MQVKNADAKAFPREFALLHQLGGSDSIESEVCFCWVRITSGSRFQKQLLNAPRFPHRNWLKLLQSTETQQL